MNSNANTAPYLSVKNAHQELKLSAEDKDQGCLYSRGKSIEMHPNIHGLLVASKLLLSHGLKLDTRRLIRYSPVSCSFHDGDRCRGSDSRHAERHNVQQVVQCPDPASCLDLNLWFTVFSHQFQVVNGSSCVRVEPVWLLDKTVSCGSFDECDADLGANLAKANDMLIVEIVVFENNLECSTMLNDRFINLPNLMGDVIPIAAQSSSNVYNHVNLTAARGSGTVCFKHLDFCGTITVREANHWAY